MTPATTPTAATPGPFADRPTHLERPAREAIAAVEGYDRSGVDLAHTRGVGVLRALAVGFATIPGVDTRAMEEARSATNELEWSRNTADDRAGRTRKALLALVRALPARVGRGDDAAAFAEVRARFAETSERIDAEQPLFMQRTAVVEAFRAAIDVLLVATGERPIHGRSATAEPPGSRPDAVARQAAIEAARGASLRLAAAEPELVQRYTAEGLIALADLLAVDDDRAAEVAVVQVGARCVRTADGATGEPTRCARDALEAALRLLEHRHPRVTELWTWSRAVRVTLAAFDTHRSLASQHALVQDAFRATLDAVVGFSPDASSRVDEHEVPSASTPPTPTAP